MATQPVTVSTFFNTSNPSINPTPSTPQTGGLLRGLQSFVYSPARHATEEAAQGLANRLSELFSSNQPEITNRVRDIFTSALVRRTPETYHQLRHHIQAFLRNPSKTDLDFIKPQLNALDPAAIRILAPAIRQEGIDALTTLRQLLDREITETPPIGSGHLATLTVNPAATTALEIAEAILGSIIENHEGALIQTLNTLTQSMSAADGPVSALREQLNHPQHGLLAGSLSLLRSQLTSRTQPQLRECKTALENYRVALARNAVSQELLPLIHTLHAKYEQLNSNRHLVPQISSFQWTQIEQFGLQVQALISNPSALTPHAQLQAESDVPYQAIAAAFNAQRGMIEEAADILVEGIGRGVEHLVPLPGRMLQGILSPSGTTPITQPGITAPSITTPPLPPTLNIGNLATQGRGFLDSILSSAGGALSQQAAQSLATMLRYCFEKIRDHVVESGTQAHLLTTINPMIERLKGAIERSSWAELTGVMQDGFRFMQEQQVYLQGLRLPLSQVRNHASAIPAFLNNINAHQNALQPPSHKAPQTVTLQMIQQQADLLKMRTASYGPARLILEKFCGLNPTSAFYAEIYRPSSDPLVTDLKAVFRDRLFEKIDQADLNFATKWFAKRMYDAVNPLSSFYLNSIIDGILKQASEWIQGNPSSQESKEEFLVKILRNWMAVTSGAYNQVANTPPTHSKDFHVMMEEALKIPERNGGLSQQELYAAVSKTALDTFGPRIKWSETIDNYFSTEISPHSPLYFLNPVAKVLNIFCSFCLKAAVFIPQWVGNTVLQGGAKLALTHTPFLKDYSEQTIESLRRNTPSSYAVQCMIFRQQQKVLELLQRGLSDEAATGSGILNRNSNINKLEIKGLVEYSLEVLGKAQYRTQDRLHNYLNNRASLRDRAGRELEETFLPEVMETAVTTITIAMKAMTDQPEMQQMLYDGFQIANDAFDANEPVSDEEFAAIEKGIRELTDQILETAIFHAIAEKFDFTNEKQKRGITQFVRSMKDQTGTFSTRLQELATPVARSYSMSAQQLFENVTSMVQESAAYNKMRVDALGMADGNRNFHTETKYHFNEVSRQLLEHSTPLTTRLNTMKAQVDEMLFFDKLLQPLMMSRQTTLSLNEKLLSERLITGDLPFLKTQISMLGHHVTTLRRNQCPLQLSDALSRLSQDLTIAVDRLETLNRTGTGLFNAQSLFLRIRQAKLETIGSPLTDQLRNLEKQLCDILDALPSSQERTQLKEHVLALMLSRTSQDALTAAGRFTSTFLQVNARNHADTESQYANLRRLGNSFAERVDLSIQDFAHIFAQNQNSVQRHAGEIVTEAEALDRWADSQNDLAIWNLFIFDMQWVTEIVKNLAFDRARSKVDQLFDALYQRHNYVGFVNQVALVPFLESFGKHHLKNLK